jgi:predicted PurR-regulated permease PerM
MHPLDRLRETRLLPVLLGITVVAMALFIFEVAGVLPPFLWAAVTAYLLFPLVSRVETILRLPRIVVVAGLYMLFVGVIVLTVSRLGPLVVDQARDLADSFPSSAQDARRQLYDEEEIRIGGLRYDTAELDAQIDEVVEGFTARFTERAVPLVLHTVELAIHTLVYFLATFYFLLHGDGILRQSRLLVPRRHRRVIDRVGSQVNATFGAYVRGQLILFVIMSVSTYIALTILDVEYRLALALATGLLELVPLIGPWIAGTIAVTVAISQGHAPFGWSAVELGVVVGLTYFALRMIEDHVVIPQLIGRIVKVHPVLVVFAVLAGAHLFGALGLLLAVPLTAAFKIIVQAVYYELANPPTRRVIGVQSREALRAARDELGSFQREQLVLLVGPNVATWDDLPVMQEMAMLAVGRDVRLNVVTPDSFAASLATASGIPVITQARYSDEVGMAESLIEDQQQSAMRRRRFVFRTSETAEIEAPVTGDGDEGLPACSKSSPHHPPLITHHPSSAADAQGPEAAGLAADQVDVGSDHVLNHLLEGDFGLPAELGAGFLGVAHQQINLCGSQEAFVEDDVILPVESGGLERDLAQALHAVGAAGRDDVVVGRVLLEHQPHRADVVTGEAPVALRVEIAERELAGVAFLDQRDAVCHLAGHELEATARALMIEEDAGDGEEIVRLPVVDSDPVAVDLRDAVG